MNRDELEEHIRARARSWDHTHEDIGHLLDRIAGELTEEANHRLRQTFSRIVGRLQIAEARTEEPGVYLGPEELASLFDAVDQATDIAAAYLDRQAVSKAMIQLEAEPTELETLLEAAIPPTVAQPTGEALVPESPRLWVDADRAKLTRALTLLASLPVDPSGAERGRLEVNAEENHAHCFVGADPPALGPRELLELLERHLDLREIRVDAAYARAVVERHEGSVLVEKTDGGLTGYGIRLPLRAPPRKGEA